MDDRTQSNVWPRLAGVAGLVLAVILTAVIWLHVIDRQATAMRLGDDVVFGTPPAGRQDAAPYPVDDAGAPRPIP